MAPPWSQGWLLLAAAVTVLAVDKLIWPPPELETKVFPIMRSCLVKYPLNEDIIATARKGKLEDKSEVKTFVLCILDTLEAIDHETGEILHYKLLDLVPDPVVQNHAFELGKECLKIHDPKAAETAFKFAECMMNVGVTIVNF